MDMPKILFVDDEPNILKTLQRLFFDEDYDLYTANSGLEALDLIENGLIPTVIVSDQRMPGMSGAEFLAKAREKVPDSIRMVLTGYADISVAVDAINLGGVYRYIVKPWNDDDLKLSISEGISRYNLVFENRKLTKELQQANLDLVNLNKDLDAQVKIRTLELSQKIKELQGRDEIQQFLMTFHPIAEFLQKVLQVIVEVTCAEGCAFLTLEEGSETSFILEEVSFFNGGAAELDDLETKAVKCLAGCESVNLPCKHTLGLSQVCLFPMAKGGTQYGVLALKSKNNELFSDEEINTFVGFVGQAVIGITDFRVHDNLDEIGESLDDVLNDLEIN